jgi:hypothetical protein
MADILDDASNLEELQRKLAIEKVRSEKAQQKVHTHCLYCNIELLENSAYCSPECKEDGELENAIRKRQFR